jgi:UDP-N-acetylbacillosamine alanyltransferase
MTLHGIDPRELMRDVYFRPDFLEIHGARGLDRIERDDFRHAAVEVDIAGSERRDLETPWGYGGPVATNVEALSAGLSEWRAQQQRLGRIAEFIRLHPFINPAVLRDQLDMLSFNRSTVLVNLDEPAARCSSYSDSTRSCIRKAQRTLTNRVIAAEEWSLLRDLYEAGLRRNNAATSYFFDDAYYRALLATPWCKAWVAEDKQGPVAVACFLHSGIPLCHYHLAGGNERARHSNAAYLLLEEAFCHYSRGGCRLMHLGGGRTTSAADPLLAFKSKFSPERAHYYIGGMIFDPAAYEELGGGRGQFLCAGAGTASLPQQ